MHNGLFDGPLMNIEMMHSRFTSHTSLWCRLQVARTQAVNEIHM